MSELLGMGDANSTRTLFHSIVNWLRAGYPDGVPPKDYYPLLALLKRSLNEDEVIEAAQSIVLSGIDAVEPVTESDIRAAIENITAHSPNAEDIQQVSARLASVGWPLATPTN